MKYLIISDAASVHIYNFVKNSLMGRGYEISILRHSLQDIPKQYLEFYKENCITVFSPGKKQYKFGKLGTVVRFVKKCFFLAKYGKADICHIHYVHKASCLLYRIFKRNYKKLILSYWGDDILIPRQDEIESQKKCFPYADLITVTVENSKRVFLERFGDKYADKLTFGRLTGGGIQGIHDLASKVTIEDCRREFNVPDNKLCVVCGYNADPSQHQDVICNEVSLMSQKIKDKTHLIIPLQYGRISDEYIIDVKNAAEKCGCSYEILEEYVPFERNSIMCLATDIYLNLRDSDAFSNAMKEQMYSGSIMIQGDWLKYKELDDCNAPVVKIKSLDELHTSLENLINEMEIKEKIQLFSPIYDIFSNEKARDNWSANFEKLFKRGETLKYDID